MLVLTRRVGESIVIDNQIHVTVTRIEGGRVRIGVDAPAWVSIQRPDARHSREERASAVVGAAAEGVQP